MCHCSSPTAIRPPGHADPPSTLSLRGPVCYDIVCAGSPVYSPTCRTACPSSVPLSVFVCPSLCLCLPPLCLCLSASLSFSLVCLLSVFRSCLSVRLFLFVCPPPCLSVFSVFCLSILSFRPFLCLSVLSVFCLSFSLVCPSVFRSCLSVCLLVFSVFRSCLSVCLFRSCLSVRLSIFQSCLSNRLFVFRSCLSFGLFYHSISVSRSNVHPFLRLSVWCPSICPSVDG